MRPLAILTVIFAITAPTSALSLSLRENYERLRGEAAAALSEDRVADATVLATQAFSQFPNGAKVTFSPDHMNVVATITPAGNSTYRMTLDLSQFKAWLTKYDYWNNFVPRQPQPTIGPQAPYREARPKQTPYSLNPTGMQPSTFQGEGYKQTRRAAQPETSDEERRVTAREEMLDRLAIQRFPWAGSDAEARERYKNELRKLLYDLDEAARDNSLSVRVKRH